MGFTLNKGEFRDALKLRCDWEIADKPSICVCGNVFNVDHAMVCRRGGFIIQRNNELRDLEADILSMICNDVEIEPILQELTGESQSVFRILLILDAGRTVWIYRAILGQLGLKLR